MTWLRRKLDSAISCAIGMHRACDGFAAYRVPQINEDGSPRYGDPCACTCHQQVV